MIASASTESATEVLLLWVAVFPVLMITIFNLQEAFHPDLGIFLQTEDGAMFPNPAAQLPPKLQTDKGTADAFRLLGSMLGMGFCACCATLTQFAITLPAPVLSGVTEECILTALLSVEYVCIPEWSCRPTLAL